MAYKIITEGFWTDPKIKKLSSESKLLFLYLITNPHSHFTGIYYLPKEFIRIECGLSDRGIDRGMGGLSGLFLCDYDDINSVIFVRKMLKYQSCNQFYNDKQIKGIANHLRTLHNSCLIADFLKEYSDLKLDFSYTPIDRGIDTPTYTVTDTDTDTDTEEKGIVKGKNGKFISPTLEEVSAYCLERKNKVNPKKWLSHYEAKGWMIGKNKMKDWKAAVRTWEENQQQKEKPFYQRQSGLDDWLNESQEGGKGND